MASPGGFSPPELRLHRLVCPLPFQAQLSCAAVSSRKRFRVQDHAPGAKDTELTAGVVLFCVARFYAQEPFRTILARHSPALDAPAPADMHEWDWKSGVLMPRPAWNENERGPAWLPQREVCEKLVSPAISFALYDR